VDGVATTIASQDITEERVFTPGNYNGAVNGYSTGLVYHDESTLKNFDVTLNGATITAKLTQVVRFDGYETNDVSITLNTGSSLFLNETRYGIYAETPDVACTNITVSHIRAGIPQAEDPKFFVSIYDDSVPEQVAEFDVTSIFASFLNNFESGVGGILTTNQKRGCLVAGGAKALWMHQSDPDEEDPRFMGPGPFKMNDCVYRLSWDSETDTYAGTPVLEFTDDGSSWSSAEFLPYSEVQEYDWDGAVDGHFSAHPFQLGYTGLPVFAQHSYPLAAAYRMTGVSSESTDSGYNLTVTHEFYAGEVIWPLDGSLPYVDDADPTILYSIDETREIALSHDFDPNEDYIRLRMSLVLGDDAVGFIYPIAYFEADPDLSAFAIGFQNSFFEKLDKLGLAKVTVGTPGTYSFNFYGSDTNHAESSASAAPGGKLAITEMYWSENESGGPETLVESFSPDSYRFATYSSDGPELEVITEIDDGTNYPPRFPFSSLSGTYYFTIQGCSDEYVYINGPIMDHKEAQDFAGHSLPYIDRRNPVNHSMRPSLTWLISWDGAIRVPTLNKFPYEPDYRDIGTGDWGRIEFLNAFPSRQRINQPFDCIKDSSLPFAPVFGLSEETQVPFVDVFDEFYIYSADPFGEDPQFYPGTIVSKPIIDLVTWTVPDGCTQITVEAWGGGGGGATGFDSEPYII
jgi:hypothetical protein